MNDTGLSRIATVLEKHRDAIHKGWLQELKERAVRLSSAEEERMSQQCVQLLDAVFKALRAGHGDSIDQPGWNDVRQLLTEISQLRAKQGSTPTETATFVFSLKKYVFDYLRQELADEPAALAEDTWAISSILDQLGLLTVEVFQRSREQIIARQHQELLELSTPVVKLWDNVLALPLIGTLDSVRAQTVMENLLQEIVDTGSTTAIIDISGVPTVDTLVAQHLLKTVAATRLMGADCIISGIRPQIAQTIVQMGVDLQDVVTKASLADALVAALSRTGMAISTQKKV